MSDGEDFFRHRLTPSARVESCANPRGTGCWNVAEGDEFEVTVATEENDDEDYTSEAVLEPFTTFMHSTTAGNEDESEREDTNSADAASSSLEIERQRSQSAAASERCASSQSSPSVSEMHVLASTPVGITANVTSTPAANVLPYRSPDTQQQQQQQIQNHANLCAAFTSTTAPAYYHRPSSSIWQPARICDDDYAGSNENHKDDAKMTVSERAPPVALSLAKLLMGSQPRGGADTTSSMSATTDACALQGAHNLSHLQISAVQNPPVSSPSTSLIANTPATVTSTEVLVPVPVPAFYYHNAPYSAALLSGGGEQQQYFTVHEAHHHHATPYHPHLYYGTAAVSGAGAPIVNYAQLSTLTCIPPQPAPSMMMNFPLQKSNNKNNHNNNAVAATIFPTRSLLPDTRRESAVAESLGIGNNNLIDPTLGFSALCQLSTPLPPKSRREGRRGPKTNAFQELKQLREQRCFPSSQSAREDHNLKERCRRGIFTVYVEEVLNAARGYGRRRDKITILDSAFNMFQLICQPHYAHLIPQALEKVEQMRLAGTTTLSSNIAAASNPVGNDDACEASSSSYAATSCNGGGRGGGSGLFLGGTGTTSRSNAVLEVPLYGSLAGTNALMVEAASGGGGPTSKRKRERKVPPSPQTAIPLLYVSEEDEQHTVPASSTRGKGLKNARAAPSDRAKGSSNKRQKADGGGNTSLFNHALYDYCSGGASEGAFACMPSSSSSSLSRFVLTNKQQQKEQEQLLIVQDGATSSEPYDDAHARGGNVAVATTGQTAFTNSMMLSKRQQQQQHGVVMSSGDAVDAQL